jgi:predicted permease
VTATSATAARALWLLLASVAACLGLSLALWGFHHPGERVLSLEALLRYAVVVVALALVGYALQRLAFRLAPAPARARAVVDAAIAGLLVGPVAYAVLDFVATIRDCSAGGC